MAVVAMEGLNAGIVEEMEGGNRCALHGYGWLWWRELGREDIQRGEMLVWLREHEFWRVCGIVVRIEME